MVGIFKITELMYPKSLPFPLEVLETLCFFNPYLFKTCLRGKRSVKITHI